MGRVSFGGSQDLSQLFAALYGQYEQRLTDLAERAARRAEEEQAAADSDAIDRWQQGEMSDDEFLAYAAQRIEETGEDEPGQNAYWKRVLRDAEKSIKAEQISDTAEDILDRIEAGKATWDDLKRFYTRQRRGLRPNDPLYEQLSDQIEEIDDRIAQNRTEGAFARVDYLFRSGSITGSQAGAQLRALAQQYKQNDPARYWQLLAQAADLERYGGTYGSGGSGGSGGSSARSANLDSLIDAYEGQKYRIDSVSKQFESGATTGTFTYENANGKVVTEEVLLRNPDGTPSAAMEALDDAQLATFDRLIRAYDRKGDRSQRDLRIQDKADYITLHIQPRNTIGRENQAQHLTSALSSAIDAAGNSDDPTLGWRRVQRIAAKVERWHHYLNRTTGYEFGKGSEATAENPELGAANRREVQTIASPEDQTTGEFQLQADALLEVARGLTAAQSAEDLAGIQPSLVALMGEYGAEAFMERAAATVDLVVGIPEGRYVRAYVPGQGLVFTPTATTMTTVIGPNGQPVSSPVNRPVDAQGNPLWDESKGQQGQLVMAEINGHVEPVWAVSEQAFFIGNRQVDANTWASFQAARGKVTNQSESAEFEARYGVAATESGQAYQQMLVPMDDGGAQVWYFDPTSQKWFKNRVSKYGGVPIPFVGVNGRKAQEIASKMTRPDGTPLDPTGKAYFNATVVNAREKQAFREGDDWYRASQESARQEFRTEQRQQLAKGFASERFALNDQSGGSVDLLRGTDNRIGQILSKSAQQVGISLTTPTRAPQTRLPQGISTPRFNLAEIKPVNVSIPRITLPKINLPRISMNAGSSIGSQLQTGQNFGEGFGNSRYRGA